MKYDMHKNKMPIIIIASVTIIIAAVLIYSKVNINNRATNSENTEVKSIAVDNVVENPEKYSGVINVKGTVKEVIDNKNLFTLGCEDACVNLPVSYKGKIPKLESNIIALGEVKKDADGKFFFDAKEIKYK